MGRFIKAILVVVLLALIGFVAYAYLADLTPSQAETRKPVVLNAK